MQQTSQIGQIWENEMFSSTLSDGAQIIDAIQAWNSSYNGSGITIGIMDTGINTSHSALAGQFDGEIDFHDGGTAEDLCNHGTPVAGILASLNETYKGIAHGARFYNLKVGQQLSGGECGASSSDIIEAIDYAVANGIDVVSMSIGGAVSSCDLSITALYVNETIYQDGIPIIIAAGNGGPSNNSIWSPGCAQNAITVGSVNKDKTLSSFSSRGPVGNYNKPEILTSGNSITSTHRDGTFIGGFTGTSFATPFATGVVALMLQANPGLNWTQIKEVLANSSTDLGYAENEQGAGLVNASKAVEIALTINTTPPTYDDTIATLTKTDSTNILNASNNTEIRYQINFTAHNGTAYDAVIEETYPPQTEFVNSEPAPTNGNNIWNAGNITKGQTYQINITLNFTGTSETTITNTVNATFKNETGQKKNILVEENTTITFDEQIISTKATITKTDSAEPLNISETTILEYQINFTIQNGTAYNIVIEETYPENTTFVSSTPAPTNGNNVWNAGNITKGQTYQINITLNFTGTSETTITNTVNATYTNETNDEEIINAFENTTIIKNSPIIFGDFPGILLFAQNTSTPTYQNIHENLTLGETQTFETTGTPAWIKSEASSIKNETSIIIQNIVNELYFHTHTPENNFSNGTLLTANTGGSQRRFDTKYDINGNAMTVFATGNSTPSYKFWNGSAFIKSGTLLPDSCTSNTAWIQLAASSVDGKIIAMYTDTSGRYCAQIWNGSDWGNSKQFTTDSGFGTEKFSIEFEQQSGQALAVFETSTTGVIGYCEFIGNWCTSNSNLADRGSMNSWIRTASDPSSDRILLGTYQKGNADVETIEWNGSSFGTWKAIDTSVESEGDRIFDISYVGNTGKAMVAYTDRNQNVPSFSICENSSLCFDGMWNSNNLTTNAQNNCGENSNLDFVNLIQKPNTDEILLTALSQNNHYKCAQFYDGTGWQNWVSSLGSGSADLTAEDISAVFDAD
jgi:hypothetical protein